MALPRMRRGQSREVAGTVNPDPMDNFLPGGPPGGRRHYPGCPVNTCTPMLLRQKLTGEFLLLVGRWQHNPEKKTGSVP